VTLTPQGASAGSLSLTSLASTNFTAGAATLLTSVGQAYTYTAKKTAPSTLTIRATDPDAVSSSSVFGGTESALLIRSGQLKVFATSAGDRSTMYVLLELQYHDGVTWVTNGDDACTALAAANVAMTSPTNALATYTPAAPVLINGSGYVTIAPSASSGSPSGSVNLAINLGSSGVDQSCNTAHGGTAAGKPWLRSYFGSCSALADRDPAAQLRFGSFTNESKRQIYIREIR
jgi:MSHA biogenesis protein MshQ